MCRGNTTHWVSELPSVLLGLRTCLRDDTQISAAELVYGEAIRLPGDFFQPQRQDISDDDIFVKKIRERIANLSSVPRRNARQGNIFVHANLKDCTHVFVREDKITKPLSPPYSGPYKVIERTDKYFKIDKADTEKCISIDRLKPAFTIDTEECKSAPYKDTANVNTGTIDPKITRSGRISKPVVRFNL
nr:uncharacterized protein LOC113396632 [Vanessa tameamea]